MNGSEVSRKRAFDSLTPKYRIKRGGVALIRLPCQLSQSRKYTRLLLKSKSLDVYFSPPRLAMISRAYHDYRGHSRARGRLRIRRERETLLFSRLEITGGCTYVDVRESEKERRNERRLLLFRQTAHFRVFEFAVDVRADTGTNNRLGRTDTDRSRPLTR